MEALPDARFITAGNGLSFASASFVTGAATKRAGPGQQTAWHQIYGCVVLLPAGWGYLVYHCAAVAFLRWVTNLNATRKKWQPGRVKNPKPWRRTAESNNSIASPCIAWLRVCGAQRRLANKQFQVGLLAVSTCWLQTAKPWHFTAAHGTHWSTRNSGCDG